MLLADNRREMTQGLRLIGEERPVISMENAGVGRLAHRAQWVLPGLGLATVGADANTHTHTGSHSLYNLYMRWGPRLGLASPTNIEFSLQNIDNLAPYIGGGE